MTCQLTVIAPVFVSCTVHLTGLSFVHVGLKFWFWVTCTSLRCTPTVGVGAEPFPLPLVTVPVVEAVVEATAVWSTVAVVAGPDAVCGECVGTAERAPCANCKVITMAATNMTTTSPEPSTPISPLCRRRLRGWASCLPCGSRGSYLVSGGNVGGVNVHLQSNCVLSACPNRGPVIMLKPSISGMLAGVNTLFG